MAKQDINNIETELISIFRNLHKHPELPNEEFATTKLIREKLHATEIHILDLPLNTGLVAEITGNPKGPIIALRCDIDALPIKEETNLAYKSEIAGKMHACGHDFHTTVVLGAACLLKKAESELPGTVRLIFQPAEETAHGAEQILATDVLSTVQAIFGLHNKPNLPVGTIATAVGPLTAAVDRFEIEISGVGTHAAHPEKGIDPIVVAGHIITALQTIVSRNISAFDQALVSITHVTSGNTWNVIPETAYLEGTVRTLNPETRKFIPQRLSSIVKGLAQSFGATAELKWHPGPPATSNTREWVTLVTKTAQELGYETKEFPPDLGGEDFAYYQEKIPGAFINVGTGPSHPHHHPKFTIDTAALLPAAQYFAEIAKRSLGYLQKNNNKKG